MEAVQGCTKTLTFETDMLCNACGMFINKLQTVIRYYYIVFRLICILSSHCTWNEVLNHLLHDEILQVGVVFLLVQDLKLVSDVKVQEWSVLS